MLSKINSTNILHYNHRNRDHFLFYHFQPLFNMVDGYNVQNRLTRGIRYI